VRAVAIETVQERTLRVISSLPRYIALSDTGAPRILHVRIAGMARELAGKLRTPVYTDSRFSVFDIFDMREDSLWMVTETATTNVSREILAGGDTRGILAFHCHHAVPALPV